MNWVKYWKSKEKLVSLLRNQKIIRMRDLARQGIYRILYDIIKADSIIVRREIDAIKLLCDKYGITPKHRMASMNLSLAEAVTEVQSLTIGQVEELRKDISQLILADETSQREEALLLFAIMKAIDGKCEVVRIGRAHV